MFAALINNLLNKEKLLENMYVRNMRNGLLDQYAFAKGLCARKSPTIFNSILSSNLTFPLLLLAGFLRFQYPHDYKKPSVRTDFPGPQAQQALQDAGAA